MLSWKARMGCQEADAAFNWALTCWGDYMDHENIAHAMRMAGRMAGGICAVSGHILGAEAYLPRFVGFLEQATTIAEFDLLASCLDAAVSECHGKFRSGLRSFATPVAVVDRATQLFAAVSELTEAQSTSGGLAHDLAAVNTCMNAGGASHAAGRALH